MTKVLDIYKVNGLQFISDFDIYLCYLLKVSNVNVCKLSLIFFYTVQTLKFKFVFFFLQSLHASYYNFNCTTLNSPSTFYFQLTNFTTDATLGAKSATVKKCWEKADIDTKWAESKWAVSLKQKERRQNLNCFDRFVTYIVNFDVMQLKISLYLNKKCLWEQLSLLILKISNGFFLTYFSSQISGNFI